MNLRTTLAMLNVQTWLLLKAMRLEESDIEVIREEVKRLDQDAEVFLFGSRTDDALRGGDIDLFLVSDNIKFRDILKLRIRILDRIGWQQLDLTVGPRDQLDEPLARVALGTGIAL